ncbi:MAG: HEAT repeat domain-containing protein [Acidobacteriaceae bacterium]
MLACSSGVFEAGFQPPGEQRNARNLCLVLACCVAILLLTSASPGQTSTDGREKFAEVAQKLLAFPPDSKFLLLGVANDLGQRSGTADDARRGRPDTPGTAEFHALLQADYPVPFLLSLLKDDDPKIRTLAAAALVAKGEPRLQQYLAPLVHDPSPTFNALTTPPTDYYSKPQSTPQSVSQAALRLVEMSSIDEYDRYWRTHTNYAAYATWFLWQFLHPPFGAAAKEQIQHLPSPQRELTILWIGSGTSVLLNARFDGYSNQELLDAAKALGRENVLDVLRGNPPTSDPDIRDVLNPHTVPMDISYGHAAELDDFLLTHAKNLLTDSDARALLEIGTGGEPRAPASPELWFVAAANVRPQDADSILDVADLLWPNAGNIQLTRWDVHGQAGLTNILEHYYRSPEAQRALACSVKDDSYEPLVEAILASKERLQINGEAMYCFAELSSRIWKGKANFDQPIMDWVFAQPPDPDISVKGPPRELVVRTSGVARKLVLDPRFNNADGQLLHVVEQCLVGELKLNREQSVRLDQLAQSLYSQHPTSSPETILRETRELLRQGISNQ